MKMFILAGLLMVTYSCRTAKSHTQGYESDYVPSNRHNLKELNIDSVDRTVDIQCELIADISPEGGVLVGGSNLTELVLNIDGQLVYFNLQSEESVSGDPTGNSEGEFNMTEINNEHGLTRYLYGKSIKETLNGMIISSLEIVISDDPNAGFNKDISQSIAITCY